MAVSEVEKLSCRQLGWPDALSHPDNAKKGRHEIACSSWSAGNGRYSRPDPLGRNSEDMQSGRNECPSPDNQRKVSVIRFGRTADQPSHLGPVHVKQDMQFAAGLDVDMRAIELTHDPSLTIELDGWT